MFIQLEASQVLDGYSNSIFLKGGDWKKKNSLFPLFSPPSNTNCNIPFVRSTKKQKLRQKRKKSRHSISSKTFFREEKNQRWESKRMIDARRKSQKRLEEKYRKKRKKGGGVKWILTKRSERGGDGEGWLTGIERPRSGSRPIYESDSHRTRSSRATRLFETTAGSANIMTSFRVSSAEEWRSLALSPTPILARQESNSGGGGSSRSACTRRSDLSPCNDPRTIVGINTMNSV